MSELLSSLNWRQITIHFIATLLFAIGLRQFAFLMDIELTNGLSSQGQEFLINNRTDIAQRMTYFLIWIRVFEILGLLISGVIMFRLLTRTKYFWTNVAVVILLGLITIRGGLLDSQVIKETSSFVGRQFLDFGLLFVYLVNGLLLTILGLLIFYSNWTRKLTLKGA